MGRRTRFPAEGDQTAGVPALGPADLAEAEPGLLLRLGSENREVAEAAGPPSPGALAVLAAAREVYLAERALRAVPPGNTAEALRSSLGAAQERLGQAIGGLDAQADRPA